MSILRDVKKYNRIKGYLDYNTLEFKMAIILALVFTGTSIYFNIYENTVVWGDILPKLLLSLATLMISMIGIMFAGIALCINILKKEIYIKINRVNGEGVLESIFSSFKFLIFNLGLGAIIFIGLYFFSSTSVYINEVFFYKLLFIVTYWFVFVIFYFIGLIDNVIELYFSCLLYQEEKEDESNYVAGVNEARIDFIIKYLKDKGIVNDDFLIALKKYVLSLDSDDKEAIYNYIDKHYKTS